MYGDAILGYGAEFFGRRKTCDHLSENRSFVDETDERTAAIGGMVAVVSHDEEITLGNVNRIFIIGFAD